MNSFRVIHFAPDPPSGGFSIGVIVETKNGIEKIFPSNVPPDEYLGGPGRARFIYQLRQRILEITDLNQIFGFGPYVRFSEVSSAEMSFINELVKGWTYDPTSSLHLHHEAVSCAEKADAARARGKESARLLFAQARKLEESAIAALAKEKS